MDSATLQTFTFGTQRVRTVLEEDGIKFVAVDVCNALGLTNNREAVAGLDDDEKGVGIADTLGGKQTMVVITESGLYSLVLRSRRPEAKTFKKWVTAEVLPTLRRTGTYSVLPAPPTPAFDLPQTFSEALRLLADTHDQAEALKLQVAAQQPAVEFVESYVHSAGTFGLRETAKLLGLPPKQFTDHLQQQRICFREGGHLQPYAEHLRDGYFALRTGESNEHAFTQTRITPKGIEWLRRKLHLPAQNSPATNILQLTA
jgi:prophage antirepressor-like protein